MQSGRLVRSYFEKGTFGGGYYLYREYSYMNETHSCTMQSVHSSGAKVKSEVKSAVLGTIDPVFIDGNDAESCIDSKEFNDNFYNGIMLISWLPINILLSLCFPRRWLSPKRQNNNVTTTGAHFNANANAIATIQPHATPHHIVNHHAMPIPPIPHNANNLQPDAAAAGVRSARRNRHSTWRAHAANSRSSAGNILKL